MLAQSMITKYFIQFGDDLMYRIPIVNKIYIALQEVTKTMLDENRETFTQVVLIPFPHKKALSFGMVTNECASPDADLKHGGLVSVFLPATPNPTMGFMLMYRRDQLIFIDMNNLIYWFEKETKEVSENEISNVLDPYREVAYFFKDYRINNGKLNILQNVLDGELDRAIFASKAWKDNRINIGYLSPTIKSPTKYSVHTLEKSKPDKTGINVFAYDSGDYAAILFL